MEITVCFYMKQTKIETKAHIDVSYSLEEEEKTVCFILIVKSFLRNFPNQKRLEFAKECYK